jgi:pseudouridylate synthase / pseudouridine kinase
MLPRVRRPLGLSCRARTFSAPALRHSLIDVHPEIQEALNSKKPVVALETTLVSHGFSYPTNLELALELEAIVRSSGAIPATIGILGGRIKIGMDEAGLEVLADHSKGPNIVKVSRRDVAAAVVNKVNGG